MYLFFAVLPTSLGILSGVYALDMTVTHQAFFDIKIGGVHAGRIEFELYGNVVPKTVENFVGICKETRPTYGYVGSKMHRVIPQFMIQGGDFTRNDGTGGMSIWGDAFQDENFALLHDQPYVLSMANAGPNTNLSQFFITLVPTPWLDQRHVVFGKVVSGLEVVMAIQNVGTTQGTPTQEVEILATGIL